MVVLLKLRFDPTSHQFYVSDRQTSNLLALQAQHTSVSKNEKQLGANRRVNRPKIGSYRQNSVVDAQTAVHLRCSAIGDLRNKDSRVSGNMLVIIATGDTESETFKRTRIKKLALLQHTVL